MKTIYLVVLVAAVVLLSVSGVSVRALNTNVTAAKDKVSVNVRQNASLHWTLSINKNDISSGTPPSILWGTSAVNYDGTPYMKETLFYKTRKDATAKPSSRMPPRYAGRVKILPPATLFIERVDLSDEGVYMCILITDSVIIRKTINLTVIASKAACTDTCQKSGELRPRRITSY